MSSAGDVRQDRSDDVENDNNDEMSSIILCVMSCVPIMSFINAFYKYYCTGGSESSLLKEFFPGNRTAKDGPVVMAMLSQDNRPRIDKRSFNL